MRLEEERKGKGGKKKVTDDVGRSRRTKGAAVETRKDGGERK